MIAAVAIMLAAAQLAGGGAPRSADLERQADAVERAAAQVADQPRMRKASARDVATACTLVSRFAEDFGSSRTTEDSGGIAVERLRSMMWKALHEQATCVGGRRVVFKSDGPGAFVEAVAVDAAGFVGVRGGWQLGAWAGKGGDCLYARHRGDFVLVGCNVTSVS